MSVPTSDDGPLSRPDPRGHAYVVHPGRPPVKAGEELPAAQPPAPPVPPTSGDPTEAIPIVPGDEARDDVLDDASYDVTETPFPETVDPAGEADTEVPSAGSVDTPLGSIVGWLRTFWRQEPSAEEAAAVDEILPEGAEFPVYLVRFTVLLVLSATIAAFGLLQDSAAVVIGAMLVAPLMTPMIASAAAIVTARNGRLVRALLVVLWGTLLGVATGYVVATIAHGGVTASGELPGELQARTFPGLLDLGIAVAAGFAGGYVTPRRSTAGALPGVGIAVALVPPLATVGITAQLGLSTEARNAFLLFATNLAAIVFSAALALVLTGFRPAQSTPGHPLRLRLLLTVVGVALVAVPLTLHTLSTIDDERLQRAVTVAVAEWDGDARLTDFTADAHDGRATVEVVVTGRGDPRPAWQLAELIRSHYGKPVDLRLYYQRDELYAVTSR